MKEKSLATQLYHQEDPSITNFPNPITERVNALTDEQKIEIIEEHFRDIMLVLGLDVNDGSLAKTPRRVAEMYVREVFSGLKRENFPRISIVKDCFHQDHNAHIVFVKVTFTSFCEHHFVPIIGSAYVAYKPHNKLIGLSKIPRLVRFFAKRPQLQERLTAQIADSLSQVLGTNDVAVSINATHFCVLARGIEDQDSIMVTNVLRGAFDTNDALRREFFEAIQRKTT
ncbi:MAG: GTP cyclohydrolase I FolE [Chlamydiales bacterium]